MRKLYCAHKIISMGIVRTPSLSGRGPGEVRLPEFLRRADISARMGGRSMSSPQAGDDPFFTCRNSISKILVLFPSFGERFGRFVAHLISGEMHALSRTMSRSPSLRYERFLWIHV